MNRINKWKIDINPNIKPIVPKTTIMQGDINSNSLTIEVYQDRKPLDLIGKCIVINFALPNKKTVVQTNQGTEKNIVLEGNKATLMLKNNIMLEVGTVLTAITITEDDTLLTTRSAEIEIIEAQQLGIIDETDPDLPILQSLIMQTQTLINQVEDIKVVD